MCQWAQCDQRLYEEQLWSWNGIRLCWGCWVAATGCILPSKANARGSAFVLVRWVNLQKLHEEQGLAPIWKAALEAVSDADLLSLWFFFCLFCFFPVVEEYKCTTCIKSCFKSVWNLCHFWCFPHPKTLLCMYCINLHLILQTVLSELKYSSHPCCVL